MQHLSTASSMPSVRQAYRGIVRYLGRHGMRAGDRLPPQPELARELGVTSRAMHGAMEILVADGAIKRRQRVGTMVRDTGAIRPAAWHIGLATERYYWAHHAWVIDSKVRQVLHDNGCEYTDYCLSVPGRLPGRPLDIEAVEGLSEAVAKDKVDAIISHHLLPAKSVPVYQVGSLYPTERGVQIDLEAMVRDAARFLLVRGCKRVALVSPFPLGKAAPDMSKAAARAFAEAGYSESQWRVVSVTGHHQPTDHFRELHFDRRAGQAFAAQLPTDTADRPDGLVFLDDHTAAGAMDVLARAAACRPELTVFTNRQLPLWFPLPAWLFELDADRIAELAVGLCLRELMDPTAGPQVAAYAPEPMPRRWDPAQDGAEETGDGVFPPVTTGEQLEVSSPEPGAAKRKAT